MNILETNHAKLFWIDNTWKPLQKCHCPACRYIRCDDGDEEWEQNFPDENGDHQRFDTRIVELGVEYDC